jgi:hypothetical protein
MTLKVQAIINDALNRIAIIRFSDVLDEHPQLEAVIRLPLLETQTLSEVNTAIKATATIVLEEALILCKQTS